MNISGKPLESINHPNVVSSIYGGRRSKTRPYVALNANNMRIKLQLDTASNITLISETMDCSVLQRTNSMSRMVYGDTLDWESGPDYIYMMKVSFLMVPPITIFKGFLTLLFCYASRGNESVESLLSRGTQSLSNGNLAQALDFYTEAINIDPDNYMGRYRRATAYIAMGKLKTALPDLEKTLSLNPGFVLAHKQKALVNLKLGNLKESRASLLILKSNDDDVNKLLNDISDAEANLDYAKQLYWKGRFIEALPLFDHIIDIVPSSVEIHEMRAFCRIKSGDVTRGIEELRECVHMVSDNREGLLRVSKIMYDFGWAERSLEEVRECLKLDPDDKPCRAHYGKVRILAKAIKLGEKHEEDKKWDDCIKSGKRIIELNDSISDYVLRGNILVCKCASWVNPDLAISTCRYLISEKSHLVDAYLSLGRAYSKLDNLDEAEKAFQEVLKLDDKNEKAKSRLHDLKKRRKAASKRDYYKILGVRRDASDDEIKQAYRKLAGKSHPDRFNDPVEKEAATKRFIDINDARDVLLDSGMRAQFDQGIDPKDPEARTQGPFGSGDSRQFFFQGGKPFGFNFRNFDPFGGGNGHFEFHFGRIALYGNAFSGRYCSLEIRVHVK
nr:DnaJ (Hsp40) subfamily C member [Hymenolepis microstoma]